MENLSDCHLHEDYHDAANMKLFHSASSEYEEFLEELSPLTDTPCCQKSHEDPARQELEEREELDGASELQCVSGGPKKDVRHVSRWMKDEGEHVRWLDDRCCL